MLLEEEFEKALSLKEEPKSSLLMIDLVLLARSENISDKIADLLDAIEYDRV